MTCGIYAIRHVATGRAYVGSSLVIEKRFSQHRSRLRSGKHHAPHLQRAWNTYGEDAFSFEILEENVEPERLIEREQTYIDAMRARGHGQCLNACPTAGSRLGSIETPESNAKRSAALKGRPKTPEHAAKVGAKHKGKIVSEATREKLRQHNLGKTYGAETRAKLSAAGRGRPKSEQWRAKVSLANTGKRHTEGAKAKNAEWHRGRKDSEETRQKKSAAMRDFYDRKRAGVL